MISPNRFGFKSKIFCIEFYEMSPHYEMSVGEVTSPRWQGRRHQPPSLQKDQQLDSYLFTKIALEKLRSPLNKL